MQYHFFQEILVHNNRKLFRAKYLLTNEMTHIDYVKVRCIQSFGECAARPCTFDLRCYTQEHDYCVCTLQWGTGATGRNIKFKTTPSREAFFRIISKWYVIIAAVINAYIHLNDIGFRNNCWMKKERNRCIQRKPNFDIWNLNNLNI